MLDSILNQGTPKMPLSIVVTTPETVEKYRARGLGEPEPAMAATLERFADFDPGAPFIILQKRLNEIAAASSSPLTTEDDVARMVERGGTVALKGAGSGVYIPLSEIQKKRIREEGERLGLTDVQTLQLAMKEAIAVRYGQY